MERIVFLDRESIRAEFRAPAFSHEWKDYPTTTPGDVIPRLQGSTIAITNKVQLKRKDLEHLPDLKMIAVAATGTDCVDTDYCRENGIVVSNVRNYSIRSVPEHVFTLILALRRNLFAYRADMLNGAWQKSETFCLLDHPMTELHNSTLGIIGYGTLGRSVAAIAKAFGMRVIIAEHRGAVSVRDGRSSFDDVLCNSDVLTLHCPLTDETRGLIGQAELTKFKPNALLINCGRGGLVDENALAEVLKNRSIGGAGVDVLSVEPPNAGNPLLDLSLSNLIVTPHIAWASEEAMQKLADILVDNLEAFVGGNPQNVV
jgi:glycerate dehydrogenase